MSGRVTRRERVVFREIGGTPGGVLLDLGSGEYRRINEMGALIWQLLEGSPTRDELVARLRERLVDPPTVLEVETDTFLGELLHLNLAIRR